MNLRLRRFRKRISSRWPFSTDRELQVAALLRSKTGVEAGLLQPSFSVPPDAECYLQPSNRRLSELKTAYAAFSGPPRSGWDRKYAEDVPLLRFRGDCAFIWQRRENTPVNYVLSAYHILASKHGWLLRRFQEDGAFGAEIIPVSADLMVSRDAIDSSLEIAYLDRLLNLSDGSEKTILDIGAGYGRLGHRLHQAFPNVRTLCTDAVPESTFICEYYLNFRGAATRARAVPLHELPTALERERIDLAINVCSFPECPIAAIEWWLDLIIKYSVQYLLIVPNAVTNGGMKLLSLELLDFLGSVEAKGYQRIALDPKYDNPELQRYGGVSPTRYHLFKMASR
jgi:hypothetical protein